MRNKFMLLTIFVCGSLLSRGQFMMMGIDGNTIKFRSECNRSGYTDKTEILGYLLEVKNSRDAGSGLSTGRRQYQPIIIWKMSGASSPQFFQAITTNELIRKITLQYYKPDDIYKMNELVYTVEFENVSIAGYRQIMGSPDVPEFKAKSFGLFDEIKIVFERMTVTENKAKTTAIDSWRSAN